MRKVFLLFTFSLITLSLTAQTTTNYKISFENAVHHEAEISVTYTNLEYKVLEVRMSRTSPGRYALHEFAKNVYGVKATDGKGKELEVTRPNPHQWNVSGHDGTVKFEYTLFANRGDGTYSQVDETHAHLNMPATFAWARDYEHRPIEITFDVREDLNWKVATQLKPLEGTTYYAPDLYYFLDSPVEIADFHERQEAIDGQLIKMALHTSATDEEVDEYFGKVMAIVNAQVNLFGELPEFDYGEYVFLNCFMPNASGDGMEHRNSTIVTNSKPIDRPLGNTSLGTVSHEFIHVWNVERIRPASLEPFNFEEANMSGELWFAEGFTSYYDDLILHRAGINTAEEYAEALDGGLNYVINRPGRQFFSPVEMSYQAPFVDAATSVDPQNKTNTFISYYTYGSVLGLGLDLSLRKMDGNKNLDDFMKLMWRAFGRTEVPYTNRDIHEMLAEYAGEDLADEFFEKYIFDSQLPDYESLLADFGITLTKANPGKAVLGTDIEIESGVGKLESNALIGSPIYKAGIESEDEITTIAGTSLSEVESVDDILSEYKPGDEIEIEFTRWAQAKTVKVRLVEDQKLQTELNDKISIEINSKRNDWLRE
ncbi:M61 family metallopeptidase [Gracilimonas sediminicola]|uniref:PDZ domain-containing protein n=1 Tax=Gracilimonas sediminicola TaxID=2952158 RepID=A0A9X2L3Q5_9BACT|nr:PDZ domain-containing protein [Gracilimonas sediminicola]MCP9291810.1 PDZ domain-containing protein [Gracilimonas sediminicola]